MNKRNLSTLLRVNGRLCSIKWPELSPVQKEQLDTLATEYGFSIAAGDLQLLDGRWYVTHSGLLRLARNNRCSGIHTEVVHDFCDALAARWVVKATAFKTPRSKGFVGYGDADPSNVSSLVRGAEMRVAETRAVNRALRKAYGIGLCSVEELGSGNARVLPQAAAERDDRDGDRRPRLRDRLLLLIRQYRLDAEQVKRYAVRFCGTNSLREATREQVQTFISHLESRAAADRDKLVAQMNAASENSDAANGKREEFNAGKEEKEVA